MVGGLLVSVRVRVKVSFGGGGGGQTSSGATVLEPENDAFM